MSKVKTLLIAHRGGSALAIENTQSAFDNALNYPVDGLECDVQLTKDGVPVLFHDRTLFKFGLRQLRVKQLTFKQLRQLGANDYRDWKLSGKSILRYDDFLERYLGKTHLWIEIKSRVGDRKDGTTEKLLTAMIAVQSQVKKRMQQCHWMSFDTALMKLAAKEFPKSQLLQLAESSAEITPDIDKMNYAGVGLALQQIDGKVVDRFHQNKQIVLAYTCNGPRQMSALKRAEVDAVVSDRPDWLCAEWR